MNTRIPRIGDIVEYELTEGDAEAINRRRADAIESLPLHARVHSGAIVHVGNSARGGVVEYVAETEGSDGHFEVVSGGMKTLSRGDKYPMMITRVWGDPEPGKPSSATPDTQVNGQVFLDGNDTIWVTSVHCADEPRGFQYRD